MEFKEIISRHKNKVLNIAIIILAFVIANKIYQKQTKDIGQLEMQKDLEIKKNEILQDIAHKEEYLGSLRNIVNTKDVSEITNTLSRFAKESAVNIVSFKPQIGMEYPAYFRYSFEMILFADDYNAIGKFISKLENSTDIYIIDALRMQFNEGEGQQEGGRKASMLVSTILIKD